MFTTYLPFLPRPANPEEVQPVLANDAMPPTGVLSNAQPPMSPPARPDNIGAQAAPQPSGPAPTRNTGNARGSTMPAIPDMTVSRPAAIGRIGAAILSNSSNGLANALGAGATAMNDVSDMNRQAALQKYQLEEERRRALEAEQVARRRASGSGGRGGNSTANAEAVAPYAQATLDAIQNVRGLIEAESDWNPFDNTTGLVGNYLSKIPGTAAHDLSTQIDTIEAAVGFDRLQAMRDASPTGGALGQVSERELALLSASLGSLKQSQSKEQFLRTLESVERHYLSAVAAIQAQQAAYANGQGGGSTAPATTTTAPPSAGTGGGVTIVDITEE